METPVDNQNLALDKTDSALIRLLAVNGRASGADIAAKIGIAESSVSRRIRRLQTIGVITGYRAEVNLSLISPIQALISVRLVKHARTDVDDFRQSAPNWPGVRALFHTSGAEDYLLHVAAKSATDLREFVLNYLATHPAVKRTQTNLVFEHVPGEGWQDILS